MNVLLGHLPNTEVNSIWKAQWQLRLKTSYLICSMMAAFIIDLLALSWVLLLSVLEELYLTGKG